MKPPSFIVHNCDVLEGLASLHDESINCCVTSPPYYGLRDYGVEGQIGLEVTPEDYIQKMVVVFHEVKRVLRNDGTLWLNIGDSYSHGTVGRKDGNRSAPNFNSHSVGYGGKVASRNAGAGTIHLNRGIPEGRVLTKDLAPKNLIGIPWKLAFALQADGWFLRSEIVWHKPNPMTEAMKDRPTRAHEKIFLLSKSRKYFYDADAIAEPCVYPKKLDRRSDNRKLVPTAKINGIRKSATDKMYETRNCRDVWTITTKPLRDAHFAVFPPELPRRCISAGCPVGGMVLDPFSGAGTTGLVAVELDRSCIGIELNEEFINITQDRYHRKKVA